jgi:hypothetical protein
MLQSPVSGEDAEGPQCIVATVAGTRHVGCRDGEARTATFASPRCVLALPDRSLLVVDSGNNQLRRISEGSAEGGGPVVGTLARGVSWLSPRWAALLPDGGVLVCNAGHNRLVRWDLQSNSSSPFAGSGRKGHRDGPAASAEFNSPSSVCVCGDGTVLVADTNNHVIRAISGPPSKCAQGFATGESRESLWRSPTTHPIPLCIIPPLLLLSLPLSPLPASASHPRPPA